MKIPITIIVPIYKVEIFLKDCLDSIMNQTYKDFQCILVDDCSPDNCGKICDEYAKIDNRFLVVHKEKNEGLSEARNTGLNLIKDTDYVCFIDSDDFVHPQYLEILYNTILQTKCDVVSCNIINIPEIVLYRNINFNNINVLINNKFITGKERLLYYHLYNLPYMVMNKIYKYTLIKDIKFIKNIWYEDIRFNNSVYLKSQKCLDINYELYYYRERKGSISQSKKCSKRLDLIDSYFDTYLLYKNNNLYIALPYIAKKLWTLFFLDCKKAVLGNYFPKEKQNIIYNYYKILINDNYYPDLEIFKKIWKRYDEELKGDIFKLHKK